MVSYRRTKSSGGGIQRVVSDDTQPAIVLQAEEGNRAPDALGRPRVVKAASEVTRGAYTLHESRRLPGQGAPPHVHSKHEEAFYVLEGVVRFTVDSRVIEAKAGAFVLVPRGTMHSFEASGATPAKYLCIFSPPIDAEERESLARQARQLPPDP